MAVYLIAAKALGLCKIGFATNVQRRLKLLQTATPAAIEVIAERDGDRWTEACLHRALAEYRRHGEWFELCEAVESAFVAFNQGDFPRIVNKPCAPRVRDHGTNALARFLAEESLTDGAFAERVGVNTSTVLRWRRGAVRPDWGAVSRIVAATNGRVTANDFMPTPENGAGK